MKARENVTNAILYCSLIVVSLYISGCGGRLKAHAGDVTAPTALAYTYPVASYVAGASITNNVPNVTGGPATGFSIVPALPSGLVLSPDTGIISGTPMAPQAATAYSVTASNTAGSVSAQITIAVISSSGGTEPTPTINAVSLDSAGSGGGYIATLSGQNFVQGASATFNGVSQSISSLSSTNLVCSAPLYSAGTVVTIVVSNPGGGQATLHYSYLVPLTSFFDNFAHTTSNTLSASWVVAAGVFDLEMNTLNQPEAVGQSRSSYAMLNGVKAHDAYLTGAFDFHGSGGCAGLVARYQGPSKSWYLGEVCNSQGIVGPPTFTWEIALIPNGDTLHPNFLSSGNLPYNTEGGELKFSVVGNVLTLSFNGSQVGQTTDSTLSDTASVGMMLDTGMAFYDFQASASP